MNKETNEIEQALNFIESTELGTKMSPLWEDMSKDFSFEKDSGLRDYSINSEYSFEKISKFYNYSKKIELLSFLWKRVSGKLLSIILSVERFFTSLVSKLVLGDFGAARRFSFHIYPLDAYKKHQEKSNLLIEYELYNSKNNIFFSHNNYKAFSYFYDLKKHINLNEGIQNILEIGSGMFNFGTIISKNLASFNYYCIDLPDVALRGYLSAKESIDDDVEVYLPHQLKEFKNSSGNKKIIFLIPSQLDDLDIKIDLAINHESFSEMHIETVNEYLIKLEDKMTSRSILFLVNRFSRLQSYQDNSSDYTNFYDYNLGKFDQVYENIEVLRSYIPVQKNYPNVFYIGRKL